MFYGGRQMQPQTLENYLPHVQEQLAGIFEARPCEELFSKVPGCDNGQHLIIPTEAPSSTLFASFDQQQETLMNTETHVYNYSSNADPITQTALTKRLYPSVSETDAFGTEALDTAPSSTFDNPLHTIDIDALMSQRPISKENGMHSADIDRSIQDYHGFQSTQLSNYLESWLKRPVLADHCLQIFHGWKTHKENQHAQLSIENAPIQLGDLAPKATGGYYLRWNNTGIVINPGKKFMHHFHQTGLHIKDIDIVLVTHEDPDTFSDIQEIYELNFRLNRASGDQQIIHYYLNQKAYRELATLLKPHSKSERNAIHCLELFAESPEVEQVKLGDGILLHYFTTQPQFSLNSTSLRPHQLAQSNLGIRLELSNPLSNQASHVTLGYVSGSWSPFIGQHLAHCDILLAGIGNTNQSDYNKIVHLDDCLGYYGVCSLLEDTLPKLIVCSEFGSREGDLRLELIKKMRKEYADKSSTILPADIGMCVDLKTMTVKCSITNEYVNPRFVRVIRSSGLFGMMHYLAPANYL